MENKEKGLQWPFGLYCVCDSQSFTDYVHGDRFVTCKVCPPPPCPVQFVSCRGKMVLYYINALFFFFSPKTYVTERSTLMEYQENFILESEMVVTNQIDCCSYFPSWQWEGNITEFLCCSFLPENEWFPNHQSSMSSRYAHCLGQIVNGLLTWQVSPQEGEEPCWWAVRDEDEKPWPYGSC